MEIFTPAHSLLDHVPELIKHIALYVRAPQEQGVDADPMMMHKAADLGLMRFAQKASVAQLLREYQILSEILDAFFAREAAALGGEGDAHGALLALSRTQHAVRALQQKTVESFITQYTEAIDRKTAQLRSFSRLVSHEIRQPLGVLQVLTRVFRIPTNDGDGVKLVDALQRNVLRLADVAGKLERLVRLTRPADGTVPDQQVSLLALVRDVAHQLRDLADANGVTFDIDEALPTVVADGGRLELVLTNLLVNAIKYSDAGKETRVVRVESDPASVHPRILVRDNGLGIPKAKLELIFDQFVRVHDHLDDEIGPRGMGLGLSIVRECMEEIGGSVLVESSDGVGTTFVLEWADGTRPAPGHGVPAPVAGETRSSVRKRWER